MAIDFLQIIIKAVLISIVILVVFKLGGEWLLQGRDLIRDAQKNGYSGILYKILGLLFIFGSFFLNLSQNVYSSVVCRSLWNVSFFMGMDSLWEEKGRSPTCLLQGVVPPFAV